MLPDLPASTMASKHHLTAALIDGGVDETLAIKAAEHAFHWDDETFVGPGPQLARSISDKRLALHRAKHELDVLELVLVTLQTSCAAKGHVDEDGRSTIAVAQHYREGTTERCQACGVEVAPASAEAAA